MALTSWLVLAGIAMFACASFFFALAESSLFALGKWRARQLAEHWPVRGQMVVGLLQHPPELLATIVFGNTVANGGIVALGLWPVLQGDWPLWGTLAGALALILIGCEVLPKTLAVRAPEQWSLRVAPPMLFLYQSTGGLRWLVHRGNQSLLRLLLPGSRAPRPGLTDEEYQELLELACQQGTLAASEKEIILQIISLDRKTAGDVMEPRSKMAAIPDDLAMEEMLAAARRHRHRRLPMYDETPDTIIGVLNARTLLLNPAMDLLDAIEFPSFVPESMNLLRLLVSMERQQRGLAIVLDEFGGTAGLVTVEDILEEVVGEMRDESQPQEATLQWLGPGRWRVSGGFPLDDFRREYPVLGEVPEVNTMGGLLTWLLETVPAPGQTATYQGLRLTAEEADERRVRALLVEVKK